MNLSIEFSKKVLHKETNLFHGYQADPPCLLASLKTRVEAGQQRAGIFMHKPHPDSYRGGEGNCLVLKKVDY